MRTTTVRATAASVWDVLADFGGISHWAPNVDHSWALDEPGPGASRRIQTGRLVVIERITTWDPPRVLAYSIEGLPRVVRSVVNEWRLDARDGLTAVTLTSTIDAGPRPPRRFIARILAKRLAAASDQMLAGLAARLEAQGATT